MGDFEDKTVVTVRRGQEDQKREKSEGRTIQDRPRDQVVVIRPGELDYYQTEFYKSNNRRNHED